MDKRDANEKEIVNFWRSCGCIWIQQDRHAGFDGILICDGVISIVEIKNPSRRWMLTEAEAAQRDEIERCGCRYRIVENLEQAAGLIGMEI